MARKVKTDFRKWRPGDMLVRDGKKIVLLSDKTKNCPFIGVVNKVSKEKNGFQTIEVSLFGNMTYGKPKRKKHG